MAFACKLQRKSNDQIFLQINKYYLTLPWQLHTRQQNYKKKTKLVLHVKTWLPTVLVTKGPSVLEERVNGTQLPKAKHLAVISRSALGRVRLRYSGIPE